MRAALGRIRAEAAPLVLIVAPAGYGKSTLLAQLTQGDPAAVLIQLAAADNDPVQLWARLGEQLERIGPVAGGPTLPPADAAAAGRPPTVADLLAAIRSKPGPTTVALDDVHLLTRPQTLASLQPLIDAAGGGLRVVLAARREPGLRFARRRPAGEVTDIGISDLAFSVEQTAEYLRQRLGEELEPRAIAEVQGATDGWPAAVALAGIAIAGAPDRVRAAARLATTDRHLSAYLVQEVLASIPPTVARFAMDVAPLPEWNLPEAAQLTGRSDTMAMATQLSELALLRGDADGRMRFHELVRGQLGLQAVAADPARHTARCASAAGILEHRGDLYPAAVCWLDAGRSDEALALTARWFRSLAMSGRLVTLERMLDLLPPTDVASSASLQVACAWLAVARHDFDGAREATDRAAMLPDVGAEGGRWGTVAANIDLVRGAAGWPDLEEQYAHALAAFETQGHEASAWAAQANQGLAFCLWFRAEPARAQEHARTAHRLAAQRGQHLVAANALALQAAILRSAGHVGPAARRIAAAFEQARRHGFAGAGFVGYHSVILAEIQLDLKHYPDAGHSLAGALERLAHGSAAGMGWALATHARYRLALGDLSAAQADLERAAESLAGCRGYVLPERLVGDVAGEVQRALQDRRPEPLSERELEVLALLRTGLSKADAARRLFVAYSTVHSHTKAIYRKLGTSSKEAAIARAEELGLFAGPGGIGSAGAP
jgi:LuxR family maltose regulon positive regulatory protein